MRSAAATLALLAAALAAPPAEATFPYPAPPAGTPPQDYAAYCFLPTTSPPVRPSDFTGGTAWKLTSDQSGDPTIDASPAELFGVTGMSVDLAWQITTGRPDVTIAVLDSGIKWNDVGAMMDLADKVRLNRGELPPPEDAVGHTKPELPGPFQNPDPYDLNDDGVFNAADYAADPRVGDRNGNARGARDRFNRLLPGLLAAPVLADLDGDGGLEIIAAAMDRHVYVWRANGSPLPGWPKFTGGWTIASPAIGQLGHRRVVTVTTREGDLWVWRIRGKRPAWFWPRARHDTRNTGLFAR